jgi:DNA-binding NarL/FixJ family response regulator
MTTGSGAFRAVAAERGGGNAGIIIADRSEIFARGLTELLNSRGFEVLGSAATAEAASALAAAHPEGVVLVDEGIDGEGASALVMRLVARNPAQRAIILNGSWNISELVLALSAGAAGVIDKACKPEHLFAAIEMVLGGGIVFSSEAICSLRDQLAEVLELVSQRNMRRLALTAREAEILRLLPSSMSLTRIAARLYLSRKTIQNNATSIYRKLGAGGRAEAVARAMELGLLEPACMEG